MNPWRTILAVLACLALLAAGTALADEEKKMKVEVLEEDGKAHVKVWELKDGEEVLIEEYDADTDDERILKLDDGHICIVKSGDDKDCHFKHLGGYAMFDGDLEDTHFVSAGDHDLAWFVDDGAYLGVHLSGLSDDQAEYFDVKDGEGALVTEVVDDSPAAAAGFQIYDVIVEIDGERVTEPDEAVKAVQGHEKGDEVKIVVRRRGKNKTLKATLDEREGGAFAYAFGDEPHRFIERRHCLPERFLGKEMLRKHLMPHPPFDREELENLRADVEELRAMLEELKDKQK